MDGFIIRRTIGEIITYQIKNPANGIPLTFQEMIEAWTSKDFHILQIFIFILVSFTSKPFVFECVPVTKKTLRVVPFEFTLIEYPILDMFSENFEPFREHYCSTEEIIAFPNVRKDAFLIVPCPSPSRSNINHAHLGSFIHSASVAQITNLWERVGHEMLNRFIELESQRSNSLTIPLWLSTHGTGVSWLHVRLDTIPKYYSCSSFKTYHPHTEDQETRVLSFDCLNC